MFDILKVILNNFRSFVGEHTFVFPTAPGLYLFTGDNQVNPRLGANGTGKSSLLESVFWCLYGRTSRGLKAGDVVNWDAKKCSVEVHLNIAGQLIIVKRTQGPNSLTLDGRPVVQDELTKTLCLTPEQFLVAVMTPQFGESFFDLSPAAKLALFTDIMGLDFWLNKSTETAELARIIKVDIETIEHTLSETNGAQKAIEASLIDLKEKRDNFEAEELLIMKQLQDSLKATITDIPKWEASLKRSQQCLKGAESRHLRASERLEELGAAYEEALSASVTNKAKISATHQKIEALGKALGRLQGVGATCPVCKQAVDKKHLSNERKTVEADIAKAGSDLTNLEKASPDLAKPRADIAQLKTDLNVLTKNRDDFAREEQELLAKVSRLHRERDTIAANIAREKLRTNPFGATITEQGNKLTRLRLHAKELRKKTDGLKDELTAAEYWVGGFKRIRLFLIETTLRQLELEVNNNLSQLGLTEWAIEFDVERENKSGGITKGFTVMIKSPDHDAPVPWAAWSGGESQRLRMAGDLGLANLIMERAGLNNTIEMYDEPSKHLSPEGLLDLAETLADRAEASNRRILLIDHNTLDFGGFKAQITIVKDEQGSRIQ